MAKYTENTYNSTDIHQQMSAQTHTPEVIKQDNQRYTLDMDQQLHIDN